MKKNGKESIIKGLKYAIDLALVLLFIGIIGGFVTAIYLFNEKPPIIGGNYNFNGATISSPLNNIMVSLQNSNLGKSLEIVQFKFDIFFLLCGFINVIALILIGLQLRFIFKSFSLEDYFCQSNSKKIRNIAIVIFIWVIVDYLVRFIPDFTSLHNFISSSIGINTFRYGIVMGIEGINFKILIVSIIIYMLSIVFSYGNNLKEESSLTI
jgi:hypothetical protein